jgi:hypothetical protein
LPPARRGRRRAAGLPHLPTIRQDLANPRQQCADGPLSEPLTQICDRAETGLGGRLIFILGASDPAHAHPCRREHENDLLQEITFAIWRALPSFRGESSERTFIYRIAHNRALTHIAKRHPEQLELSMALELPDISPDPEQIAVLR